MNNIILMGRITKNPELKYSTSGKSKCNFTIAVTRKYKKDEADFINCVAWEKTAETIAEFFKKGNRILIHGRLNVRNFVDEAEETKWIYEVITDEFEFIEKKGGNDNVSQTEEQ